MILHLDYETRSVKDIYECGLDVYSNHPSTEVILASYAFGDGPVTVYQPHKENFPKELNEAFLDPKIIIWAWNCAFERNISNWVLGYNIPIRRFKDTMVLARYMALPGSLHECGIALNLDKSVRKMDKSEELKNMFCIPVDSGGKETLFGISEPIFRDWNSNPKEWEEFVEYNRQDTVAERAIKNKLKSFPLPDNEWEMFFLDQEINDRGIALDSELVNGGSTLSTKIKEDYLKQLQDMTGVENPNSRDQILPWLQSKDYPFHELGKAFILRALTEEKISDECRKALELRSKSSKTSAQKLESIQQYMSKDNRLRNMYNFFGASRTGRWSSGSGE